jgi:hypothetical protein
LVVYHPIQSGTVPSFEGADMTHHNDWIISQPVAAIVALVAFSMNWLVPVIETFSWAAAQAAPIGTCIVIALQIWLLIRKHHKND